MEGKLSHLRHLPDNDRKKYAGEVLSHEFQMACFTELPHAVIISDICEAKD